MFTVEEIVNATAGTLSGPGGVTVSGVSTDSRRVKSGELFVALHGEHFDGHDFIPDAVESGVRAFLVRDGRQMEDAIKKGAAVVTVKDTLRALGDLASFHRHRFEIPVVGVTGSNGKTTVKEMIASILSLTGPGLKTSGNLNNLIGLPQTIFRLSKEDRWAVMEMGMSEPGEIDRLAEIATPEIGVITNAFAAHLESMGSVEAVAKAKGELYLRLPSGGCAVINDDDPLISRLPSPKGVRRITFGLKNGDVHAGRIERSGRYGHKFAMEIDGKEYPTAINAAGLHNVSNSLAAAAAAVALGVNPEIIVEGLESFTPYDKRFSPEELGGIVLIDDSYNANPASMRSALETLREIRGTGRGIAVLGDMLELGEASNDAHLELGRLAASCVSRLYLLGKMSATVAEGATEKGLAAGDLFVAENHGEIVAGLMKDLAKGDYILVKGSRGMAMDKVAEGIRLEFKTESPKGAAA